jgi:cell division protein FtsB
MTDDDAPRSRFDGVAVIFGAAALILAILSVVQSARNRSLQAQVAEGQSKLAKAQALANLDNSLVQLMAKAAADKDDGALRDLLARNGVTFKAPPAPQTESAK